MCDQNSKPLYALTIGEFTKLVREIVSDEMIKVLEEHVESAGQGKDHDVIFLDDVVNLTGYQKATIYTKVSRYEIPVRSRNRPLTFSREKIEEWLENGKPSVIEKEADEYLRKQQKKSR